MSSNDSILCMQCGTRMVHYQCKDVCPYCGAKLDCSDFDQSGQKEDV